ncbi:hypothetical protein D3C87_2078410 [compost metagenome]
MESSSKTHSKPKLIKVVFKVELLIKIMQEVTATIFSIAVVQFSSEIKTASN